MSKSVLFITPHFYPRIGGVETHVYQLSKVLLTLGRKVTILTEKNSSSDNKSELDVIELEFVNNQDKREVWQKVGQYKHIFDQHDIIHVHDVAWWIFPQLFSLRKKVFITFHGWEGVYPVRWQAKLQRWFFASMARGTIHVGDFIREFYWDSPAKVIYGAITHGKKNSFVQPNKLHPRFVFLGRLEKENAISKYLQFFSKLKALGLQPVITWVGDGRYKEACQNLGTVTGMVSNPDKYLEQADVVCANSYLSILEAQGMGKIVCAVYQHRLKQRYLETFPGADQMILSGDPKDLAEKVHQLLQDTKKMKQLSQDASTFAHTQTWEKVAQQYEALWRQA